MKHHLLLIPALVWTVALPLHAAEEDPGVKLREQLRATLLQLRTAQTESANHQALAAQAEQKNQALAAKTAELEKRNAALVKQAAADKAAGDQTLATLGNKLAEREKRLTEYQAALAKWKDGYQTAAATARDQDTRRAKLAEENLVLQRDVADLRRRNLGLFNTATEILDRFQNYALGKALGAREPFIGTARVKIENLAQGYQDKILADRLPVAASKTPAPSAP